MNAQEWFAFDEDDVGKFRSLIEKGLDPDNAEWIINRYRAVQVMPLSHPDICINRHRGAVTSLEASERTDRVGDLPRVYRYIDGCGKFGATCHEAERALRMRHQTCGARFSELRLKYRAILFATRHDDLSCEDADPDFRIRRPTDTGASAFVMISCRQAEMNRLASKLEGVTTPEEARLVIAGIMDGKNGQ